MNGKERRIAWRKTSSLLVSQISNCFSVLERTFYILVYSIESKDFNCNLLLFWRSSEIVFRRLFGCTKSLLLLLVSIQTHALGHRTKDCLLATCYTMLNSRFHHSCGTYYFGLQELSQLPSPAAEAATSCVPHINVYAYTVSQSQRVYANKPVLPVSALQNSA
jgi:hypothetical protein